MNSIDNYRDHPVFKYFYLINQIPRCSYHEEKIADFLYQLGKDLGFESFKDQAGNVLIRKTSKRPDGDKSLKVIIQGHMDMVCVKSEDSDHDFSKDPIDMYEEDGWLKAKNTTLGADDAIGLAIGLAVLEDKGPMPDIDLLITASEEVGMDGAIGLDKSWLDADMLINIDSEEEGFVTCSCAGGAGGEFRLPLVRDKKVSEKTFNIKLSGLKGGHSGINILSVSNNAIKILSELLGSLIKGKPYNLYSFRGGDKHNAIPDSASALVSCPYDMEEEFISSFNDLTKDIRERLLKQEPDIKLEIEEAQVTDRPLTVESTEDLLNLINILPHGVYQMDDTGKGVLASDNLAVVNTKSEQADIELSLRSSSYSVLEELKEEILRAVKTFNGDGLFKDSYPAWEFVEESELRDNFLKVYKEMTGEDAEVFSIHAGLECGLFAEKNPKLDMISIGPNIKGAHTIRESLDIASTIRTYDYVKKLLHSLVS